MATRPRRPPLSSSRDGLCRAVLFAGVLPFCLGVAVILAILRYRYTASADVTAIPAAILHPSEQAALTGCPPAPLASSACNCSTAIAQNAKLNRLASHLSDEAVHTVLHAANSTDPGDQTVRVNASPLPSVFLFVGILSGRGYRHRRLAVREAWANLAQERPGESVCRFILSEDESTPQVLCCPLKGLYVCGWVVAPAAGLHLLTALTQALSCCVWEPA